MPSSRVKRGAANRRLDLLAKLRPLLRARVDPERMLRSVTSLLAVEIGQYCIADVVDAHGGLRRLEIEHADPSRRARLRVASEDAVLEPNGRVARLAATGGSEVMGRVTEGAKSRSLGDIRLLDGDRVRSYMAAAVPVNGATMAVLSLVVTNGTRRYDDADLGFLVNVAEWTGLGLENALRREPQARATLPPRSGRQSLAPAPPMGDEEIPTGVRRKNPLRERERVSR